MWDKETGGPHGIEGIIAFQEEEDDPEVLICGGGPSHGDNEADDDDRSECDNRNSDPVQGNPQLTHTDLGDPKGNQCPMPLHEPRALVAPAPNLHLKCPIFSTKSDKDALAQQWLDGFSRECGRMKMSQVLLDSSWRCPLCCESPPVGNHWNILHRFFHR